MTSSSAELLDHGRPSTKPSCGSDEATRFLGEDSKRRNQAKSAEPLKKRAQGAGAAVASQAVPSAAGSRFTEMPLAAAMAYREGSTSAGTTSEPSAVPDKSCTSSGQSRVGFRIPRDSTPSASGRKLHVAAPMGASRPAATKVGDTTAMPFPVTTKSTSNANGVFSSRLLATATPAQVECNNSFSTAAPCALDTGSAADEELCHSAPLSPRVHIIAGPRRSLTAIRTTVASAAAAAAAARAAAAEATAAAIAAAQEALAWKRVFCLWEDRSVCPAGPVLVEESRIPLEKLESTATLLSAFITHSCKLPTEDLIRETVAAEIHAEQSAARAVAAKATAAAAAVAAESAGEGRSRSAHELRRRFSRNPGPSNAVAATETVVALPLASASKRMGNDVIFSQARSEDNFAEGCRRGKAEKFEKARGGGSIGLLRRATARRRVGTYFVETDEECKKRFSSTVGGEDGDLLKHLENHRRGQVMLGPLAEAQLRRTTLQLLRAHDSGAVTAMQTAEQEATDGSVLLDVAAARVGRRWAICGLMLPANDESDTDEDDEEKEQKTRRSAVTYSNHEESEGTGNDPVPAPHTRGSRTLLSTKMHTFNTEKRAKSKSIIQEGQQTRFQRKTRILDLLLPEEDTTCITQRSTRGGATVGTGNGYTADSIIQLNGRCLPGNSSRSSNASARSTSIVCSSAGGDRLSSFRASSCGPEGSDPRVRARAEEGNGRNPCCSETAERPSGVGAGTVLRAGSDECKNTTSIYLSSIRVNKLNTHGQPSSVNSKDGTGRTRQLRLSNRYSSAAPTVLGSSRPGSPAAADASTSSVVKPSSAVRRQKTQLNWSDYRKGSTRSSVLSVSDTVSLFANSQEELNAFALEELKDAVMKRRLRKLSTFLHMLRRLLPSLRDCPVTTEDLRQIGGSQQQYQKHVRQSESPEKRHRQQRFAGETAEQNACNKKNASAPQIVTAAHRSADVEGSRQLQNASLHHKNDTTRKRVPGQHENGTLEMEKEPEVDGVPTLVRLVTSRAFVASFGDLLQQAFTSLLQTVLEQQQGGSHNSLCLHGDYAAESKRQHKESLPPVAHCQPRYSSMEASRRYNCTGNSCCSRSRAYGEKCNVFSNSGQYRAYRHKSEKTSETCEMHSTASFMNCLPSDNGDVSRARSQMSSHDARAPTTHLYAGGITAPHTLESDAIDPHKRIAIALQGPDATLDILSPYYIKTEARCALPTAIILLLRLLSCGYVISLKASNPRGERVRWERPYAAEWRRLLLPTGGAAIRQFRHVQHKQQEQRQKNPQQRNHQQQPLDFVTPQIRSHGPASRL